MPIETRRGFLGLMATGALAVGLPAMPAWAAGSVKLPLPGGPDDEQTWDDPLAVLRETLQRLQGGALLHTQGVRA